MFEMQAASKSSNRYSIDTVNIRVRGDRVVAKMLRDALRHIRDAEYDLAYEILQEAHRLSPDYFEVARVAAFFHQKTRNYSEARANYELAIALAPKTAQLHFWFGRYLLKEEESLDEAVEQFEVAHKLDVLSAEVGVDLARGYMFQHRFAESRAVTDQIPQLDPDSNLMDRIYDIKVQLHYREADDLSLAEQVRPSILALKAMREEFDSMPGKYKNAYIRNKLAKVRPTIQRLMRLCRDDEKGELLGLQVWLNSECRES